MYSFIYVYITRCMLLSILILYAVCDDKINKNDDDGVDDDDVTASAAADDGRVQKRRRRRNVYVMEHEQ